MNAVVFAVLSMLVLSLLRVNVAFSLIIGALLGGLVSGLGLDGTITAFTDGLGDGASVALSYAMLGGFAVAISSTGLPEALVNVVLKFIGSKEESRSKKLPRALIIFFILVMACFSQNVVPVHIAFIPLLIPPLLQIMNELKIDRRLIACVLTFGLVTPYMLLPVGFGQIFHEIVVTSMGKSGLDVSTDQVPYAMILPAVGMVVGLIISVFFTYRKPREYAELHLTSTSEEEKSVKMPSKYGLIVAVLSIAAALAAQLETDSMVFGAMAGIVVLYVFRAIRWSEADHLLTDGMRMMAFIGFVLIAASGFANVVVETGHVESLVQTAADAIGGNKALGALLMLLVGLLVTVGVGSSFSTIPIIATIFVPLALELGFSPMATIALVTTAGVLGDGGSPVSDSTLGPTAGLNADGQHDHIWDTSVPTFIHYNIPLLIFGWIAAMTL
ncbi:Na+/H+ antiporter NhaC family protein [Domibacillus sp. DTU_2020_1001157_1_SI_ALB_TIR_016]|uniref:Na+/H+ antiporter family protein n=1 Tax=Domibacillus sp. DTU_2020_1001157_1_SI_ALB_TIR_016 TaxID=3077789 RepID=UPI0028E520BC|nr:Na+/H+ antiporter NhaC family protein [Domibacillus sp. DTU_2020_1001157_1_SI_ALB_TIR_016]WNS81628.1 Na+/H+ antiporter NhaC family protein [Domibacillus sp. DTU_2020_1001157_1_SI_ALB_TIR_016]